MARKKIERKIKDTRLQEYELVYIVSPEVADESLETRVDNISQFITGKEGVIDGVEKWGRKSSPIPSSTSWKVITY